MNAIIDDKAKFYGIVDELNELTKEMKKKIPSALEAKYTWICRNLSVYRNCFINDNTLSEINLDTLAKLLKVNKVNVNPCKDIDAGVSYGVVGYVLSI